LGVEVGGAVVLAAIFMAAGWLLFGRDRTAVPPASDRPRAEAKVTPRSPALVAELPKPVENPAAIAAPPMPVAPSLPKAVETPVPSAEPPPPPKPTVPSVTNLTFQRDILPVLKAKCVNCHGENKRKLKGGLDVSTVKSLEKGGDGGPALNRQQPDLSLLWESVASGQMPPGKGTKLTESEKKKLHDWIVGGGR